MMAQNLGNIDVLNSFGGNEEMERSGTRKTNGGGSSSSSEGERSAAETLLRQVDTTGSYRD